VKPRSKHSRRDEPRDAPDLLALSHGKLRARKAGSRSRGTIEPLPGVTVRGILRRDVAADSVVQ